MIQATTTPAETMMLRSSLLVDPPVLMPMNFPDMWWVVSSVLTLLMLAALVFFIRRLILKFDKMSDSIIEILLDQRGTNVQLQNHLDNKSIHCKGMNCPGIEKRLQQN
jgi:hypothetical protein